ncbi:MAG: hypothetical protein ACQGVK_08300 [Myxococcota bacterium]
MSRTSAASNEPPGRSPSARPRTTRSFLPTRSSGAAAWLAALALAALAPGAARAAEEPSDGVDLIGTWFVVAHYRDTATANPEADRWEDRVWIFERKGSRLQWTDYPIVVFEDPTGRFEARGANTRARTLSAWVPNEAQREEIAEGPRVNGRGSKAKSLRGSDDRGYASTGGLRAQGAMTIGYHESWSIDAPTTLPVFTREDVMGTGRSRRAGGADQTLEGVTRWTTRSVEADGTLRGDYQRDENRRGDFIMMRAGSVRDLESDGRTPNEKAADRAREQISDGFDAYVEELMKRIKAGDDEAREELRQLREEMSRRRNRER